MLELNLIHVSKKGLRGFHSWNLMKQEYYTQIHIMQNPWKRPTKFT